MASTLLKQLARHRSSSSSSSSTSITTKFLLQPHHRRHLHHQRQHPLCAATSTLHHRPATSSSSSSATFATSTTSTSTSTLSSFAPLTELDLQHFSNIVGPSNLITEADALAAYNTDWMGKYFGASTLALRPGSTKEVSQILSHCHERQLAVVPQGGNTGLVGGSVALGDRELVLSLSRMNRVLEIDTHGGHLVCEAGCVLEALQDAASSQPSPL